MKNIFASAVLSLAVLSASPAQARTVTVDVVRFHTGLAATGQTVALQPADPSMASSLEFSSYANSIGAALEKLGFKPAIPGPGGVVKADYLGVIGYSQMEREAPNDGRGSGFSIGVGIGSFGRHGGVSVGGSVPVGGASKKASGRMIRTTSLELTLKVPGATTASWEGRAVTEEVASKTNGLPEMMPLLTEALLTDFPGATGKTAKVKVKTPAKK
jgi:hypothetical protein